MTRAVALSPRLARIVAALVAKSERTRRVSIDALGEAFGASAASSADIDAVMTALEAHGRVITAPRGGDGVPRLTEVLHAARALHAELGRAPRVDELATRTALAPAVVWRALAFARVLGRGTPA